MNRMILIGAVVVAAIGGAVYWYLNQSDDTPAAGGGVPLNVAAANEIAEEAGIIDMALGPADADVWVVEYASFTCPHCATFHNGPFKQLMTDYIDTGKIRFVYRDVYFDRPGLWAAMVARCAGPDRFFGIADMLYDQQRDWLASGEPVGISNALRRIGKVAGLSEEQLDACLSDQDKAEALNAWYEANAEGHEITSTPTLIIDGQKHGNMAYSELSRILNEKLGE